MSTSYYGYSTTWKYDQRGRVVSESKTLNQWDTFTTAWAYNSADLVTSQTYPGGEQIDYAYTLSGDLSRVDTPYDEVFLEDARYDEAGRVTRMDYGYASGDDILKKTFNYYAWTTATYGGMLQDMSVVKTVGGTTHQDLAYEYDANGNVSEIFDDISDETSAFTYDSLSRITAMTVNNGQSNVHSEVFNYDANTGRMASKGPSQQDLTSFSYYSSLPHAVQYYGDNEYGYDYAGNQSYRGIDSESWEYGLAYNPENRLYYVDIFTTPEGLRLSLPGLPGENDTETPTPEVRHALHLPLADKHERSDHSADTRIAAPPLLHISGRANPS